MLTCGRHPAGQNCKFGHPPRETLPPWPSKKVWHGHKARTAGRQGVFRRWLVHTFGLPQLRRGGGVLDVAGGQGKLAWELLNINGVRIRSSTPAHHQRARIVMLMLMTKMLVIMATTHHLRSFVLMHDHRSPAGILLPVGCLCCWRRRHHHARNGADAAVAFPSDLASDWLMAGYRCQARSWTRDHCGCSETMLCGLGASSTNRQTGTSWARRSPCPRVARRSRR